MKKVFQLGILVAIIAFISLPANAAVYTLVPSPSDMWDLSHPYYYTWGIEWDAAESADRIIEAKLTFHNIYDWQVEDDDFLYTHLLDFAPVGTNSAYDGNTTGDFFTSPGYSGVETFVGVWSDPAGGSATGFDLTYSFSDLGLMDNFRDYIINDGVVGFGFDADCHYYNDGITLEVTTIPEPISILLLGLGLAGTGALSRFNK